VKDLAQINMFFSGLLHEGPKIPVHAVVNAGTGVARTFKAVAEALIQVHGPGKIEYIPFPGDLKNRYQHYTQAETTSLRACGYTAPFTPIEEGVKQTFAEEAAD
jgi:ADP-L-glycero-D-manno-heptose 6-epimerase